MPNTVRLHRVLATRPGRSPRQDARASLAERDLARETTQARLGRPGHRVTADPKPIREAGK